MARIAFVLIVVMGVLACSATADYNNKLEAFVGKNDRFLLAEMGEPSAKKIVDDSTQIWAYSKVDDVYVPDELYGYNQGNPIYGNDGLSAPFLNSYLFSNNPQDFGYEAKYWCKTLFLVKNGKIESWKWSGNNCN